MPIPPYHSFIRPALELLNDGLPRHWRDLLDPLAIAFELTSQECEIRVPSGQKTVFGDRVQWALTYLRKAGALVPDGRGVSRITPRGKLLLVQHDGRIDADTLRQFPEFENFIRPSKKNTPASHDPTPWVDTPAGDPSSIASGLSPSERMEEAFSEQMEVLAQELLDRVRTMDPAWFEGLIVKLMLSLGYGTADEQSGQTLGRSGDGGVDGVIHQDRLGLERIYLQAKRWTTGAVGRPEIQSFIGALSGQGATKGVFITTSAFTRDARSAARDNQSFKLSLIDGSELAKLMIDYNLGVILENRYDLKRIDSGFFADD